MMMRTFGVKNSMVDAESLSHCRGMLVVAGQGDTPGSHSLTTEFKQGRWSELFTPKHTG